MNYLTSDRIITPSSRLFRSDSDWLPLGQEALKFFLSWEVLAFSFIYLVGRWLAWSHENQAGGNEKLHAQNKNLLAPDNRTSIFFSDLFSVCSLFFPSLPHSILVSFPNLHNFNFCNNAKDFRNKTRLVNASLDSNFSLLKVLSFATSSSSEFNLPWGEYGYFFKLHIKEPICWG